MSSSVSERCSTAVALVILACTGGSQRDSARAALPASNEKGKTAMAQKQSPCAAPKTAAELREAARSALGSGVVWADFAPLLPTRWPAAGGGIVYWIYHSEALPSGMVRYKVRGPTEEISFPSLSAPPAVRRIGPGKVLGTEDPVERSAADESRLLEAEQAVVELVAGCRDADAARAGLKAYADWLRLHPFVSKDLETRAPTFLAWLKAKGPPG